MTYAKSVEGTQQQDHCKKLMYPRLEQAYQSPHTASGGRRGSKKMSGGFRLALAQFGVMCRGKVCCQILVESEEGVLRSVTLQFRSKHSYFPEPVVQSKAFATGLHCFCCRAIREGKLAFD
eukprot:989484-Amphidinium_carterae.1